MGIIHFLNVKNGDCSIIQHATGRVSVIDVCNAGRVTSEHKGLDETLVKAAVHGNFNQKDCPVNPTAYLKRLGVTSIFRFILTHPDMDHMDGLHALYKEFPPANFWDTDNAKTMNFGEGSPYSKEDWCLYRSIRDGTINNGPKRLTLYAGSTGQYWSQGDNGDEGDGLQILAPTRRLVNRASKSDDYNDASYVIL